MNAPSNTNRHKQKKNPNIITADFILSDIFFRIKTVVVNRITTKESLIAPILKIAAVSPKKLTIKVIAPRIEPNIKALPII